MVDADRLMTGELHAGCVIDPICTKAPYSRATKIMNALSRSQKGVCAFNLNFQRARSEMPDPATLRCELDRSTGKWMTTLPKQKTQAAGTVKHQESWIEDMRWIQDHKPASGSLCILERTFTYY